MSVRENVRMYVTFFFMSEQMPGIHVIILSGGSVNFHMIKQHHHAMVDPCCGTSLRGTAAAAAMKSPPARPQRWPLPWRSAGPVPWWIGGMALRAMNLGNVCTLYVLYYI